MFYAMSEEKAKKNHNVGYVRRAMRRHATGEYRISKDTPEIVAKAVDDYIRKVTMVAAEFAMNAGRCTIKAKDAYSAVKVLSPPK